MHNRGTQKKAGSLELIHQCGEATSDRKSNCRNCGSCSRHEDQPGTKQSRDAGKEVEE